jgi:hypothetical protein
MEANAEQRRAFYEDILNDFFNGNHALTRKVGKNVKVIMKSEDERELLLARIMKIPKPQQVLVFLDRLVTKLELADRFSKAEEAMRDKEKNPHVCLHYHYFAVPLMDDGGWLDRDPDATLVDPLFKKWQLFYERHNEYITQGSFNQVNLKDAVSQNLPIEITYTEYRNEMLRFLLIEPYPETQVGPKIYLHPIKKTKK